MGSGARNRGRRPPTKYKELRKHSPNILRDVIDKPKECADFDGIVRRDISSMFGKVVRFSGELDYKIYKNMDRPIMLKDISIGGIYIQHMWLTIDKDQINKLVYIKGNTRVYMTGKVYRYSSDKSKYMKYGIKKAKLVEEII